MDFYCNARLFGEYGFENTRKKNLCRISSPSANLKDAVVNGLKASCFSLQIVVLCATLTVKISFRFLVYPLMTLQDLADVAQ